jgi:hypothetical protein
MSYESGTEVPHAEEDDLESENIPPAMEGNESDRCDPFQSEPLREMGSDVDNVPDQSSDETVHSLR